MSPPRSVESTRPIGSWTLLGEQASSERHWWRCQHVAASPAARTGHPSHEKPTDDTSGSSVRLRPHAHLYLPCHTLHVSCGGKGSASVAPSSGWATLATVDVLIAIFS